MRNLEKIFPRPDSSVVKHRKGHVISNVSGIGPTGSIVAEGLRSLGLPGRLAFPDTY